MAQTVQAIGNGRKGIIPSALVAVGLCCCLWLLTMSAFGQPQSNSETQVFDAAGKAFQDGVYDRAEREFGEFVRAFPLSPRVSEAILLQARAALLQQRLKAAADLLTTNAAVAGRLAEDYQYWLAETQLRSTNFQASAETFAKLINQYTNSVRLLEASYGEALARFKLQQWDQVVRLLTAPEGAFQKAARSRANDALVARGGMLAAEALLEQRQYGAAEAALQHFPGDLTPEYKWRRQYLLCRIQMADARIEQALASSTNLVTLATATGQPLFAAESTALQAGLLEQLGRWSAAAQVYEQNLAETIPAERRQQARLKVIQLLLAENRLAEAVQKLEGYLAQPNAGPFDLTWLTLGELYLRQHLAGGATNGASGVPGASPATNRLVFALAQFDKLVAEQPKSPLAGKAHLDRGWCFWLDAKMREAQAAFRLAMDQLPWSVDQATARIKLGETQMQLKEYTNALQTFRELINELPRLPVARDALMLPANFHLLQLHLELNDLAGANAALERILAADPDRQYAPRGLLLFGQRLNAAGQPAEARALLARFLEKFGDQSPLRARAELALARAHVIEKNWPAALSQYESWLARYPTNELRLRAEFNYARANYYAGRESNAFHLFTNFVARYRSNELAAWAQFWVGDYYFGQKDSTALRNAEAAYQRVYQDWAGLPLAFQARLMAGRAAFARQEYGQAENYFTNLVNEPACPPELAAETFFALGDTLLHEVTDTTRGLAKFSEARKAFEKITQFEQLYPTSPLVPAAWGRIGDCWLQLATQDAKLYDNAAESYQKAAASPHATVEVRSQAEVGLGLVLERQAELLASPASEPLWQAARDHYLNVLYAKALRPGEKPSPFWQKEAGLAAARLAEARKQWEVAVNIYQRLLSLLPSARPALEKRLQKAQQQLSIERN